MIDSSTISKGWNLLDPDEKRKAWMVLAVVMVASLMSALMVGSVLPFLSVLTDPSQIETSRALSWLYDVGGFEDHYAFTRALGFASIALIVVTNLSLVLRTYVVSRFSMMRSHSISRRLLSAYLERPYEYFLDHHSGEMGSRLLTETQQVVMQFFRPAADAVSALFTVMAIGLLLLVVEPAITVSAFVLFGGVYAVTILSSRRYVARLGRVREHANRGRFTIANESLSGIKDVKLAGSERAFLRLYSEASERMARAQVWVNVISQSPQYLLQTLAFGGIILFCLLLLDPAQMENPNLIGDLAPVLGVFAFGAQRMLPELSKLFGAVTVLQYGRAAVRAVAVDMAQVQWDGRKFPNDLSRLCLSKELMFENICYTYPGAQAPSLNELSLTIAAGEKIGIVGGTGAGKTTMADLLMGLLEPSSGRILADGVAITQENRRAWCRSVGYVPQEIFLTSGTIAENIAFGIPTGQIDRARLERSARTAQIHDYILQELPEGYDTAVGERGVRLSGGQRQRIGIARALYREASLIVFDEATSALDNLTELDLMTAIEALPGRQTVVMIAHRLTTVRRCHRIVLLERGRIEAIGTWDDLIRDSANFRALAADAGQTRHRAGAVLAREVAQGVGA